jgi:transcription-repair coupling factor (superfamily II helicase)
MSTTPARKPQNAGRLLEVCKRLDDAPAMRNIAAALTKRERATLEGVWGSSCALVAARLSAMQAASTAGQGKSGAMGIGESGQAGLLAVVLPRIGDVDEFYEDLRLFLPRAEMATVARLPAWEGQITDHPLNDEIFGERLRTIKRLHEGREPTRMLVTCIQALLQPTISTKTLDSSRRRFRVGERLDIDGLRRWLIAHRFEATTAVELPGEFSLRGGILDLFAADAEDPIRIELFDDEIASIRRFDRATQRSLDSLQSCDVTVVGEFSGENAYLTDVLPKASWFALLEPDAVVGEGKQYLQRSDRPDDFHSVEQVLQRLMSYGMVSLSSIATSREATCEKLQIQSVERFTGNLSKVQEELDAAVGELDLFLACQTTAEEERLRELLQTSAAYERSGIEFVSGTLKQGFRLPELGIAILSANELFHRAELRRGGKRHLGKAIDSFLDLKEGDLVVHLAHGIARYRGLKLIRKEEHAEEHLSLEFAERTMIYVPAAKMHLVQKYVGGTSRPPQLAKIGGKAWVRQRKAAEEAVVDLAADMLAIQATRSSRAGIAFSGDSLWQREFEASFPYVPTADQSTAIEAIRQDMESAKAMDRLLCGDVGFGKTEVSMRASFKAVDNGYQVAVLVPTTILAEQHYHTFRDRMAEFPITIGKLSRFCTREEEKQTLAELESGKVDIVVGTHRLASTDVRFKNLGLVIIDEEQRFGVEVKERLKTLRSTVDILTMTATPIPRTLHMSLVGLRDISNLETPPEERMAVETHVTRFDTELIRSAVLRELNRGGQIYFVHNRVEDIEFLANRLRHIVPEARIEVGHGQMDEEKLERVMVGFVEHRFDLLVATTIVESGLDIPNANTIFIDEADRYGLADLHQLRGRVGRYKHRAYCYMLLDPGKTLTQTAAKRLRAIEEFSSMGAGFQIAMRDLEIRGAGNLLGTQQSGHIAAVGYELYCEMLENAVRELKNMPRRMSIEVDINLTGEAFLPDDYIPDIRQKIDFYRRMSRVESFDQVAALRSEMTDRFGPPPPEAKRMLIRCELKLDAAIWSVQVIRIEEKYLIFEYADRTRIDQLAKQSGGLLRVVDQRHGYVTIPEGWRDPDGIAELARKILRGNLKSR